MTPQQPAADPLDFTAQYNTPLPAEKQATYQLWRAGLPKQLQSQRDYDLQGAFLGGAGPSSNAHLPDTYKKPNHHTFSDESIYNWVDGYVGGKWTDAGYQPSTTNIGMHGPTGMQQYFKEAEPATKLLPPAPVPQPTGPGGVYRIQDFKAGAPTYTPRPQRFFGGPSAQ